MLLDSANLSRDLYLFPITTVTIFFSHFRFFVIIPSYLLVGVHGLPKRVTSFDTFGGLWLPGNSLLLSHFFSVFLSCLEKTHKLILLHLFKIHWNGFPYLLSVHQMGQGFLLIWGWSYSKSLHLL